MQDKYGRNIEYLRISVTDRCNFRCVYCMPAEGVQLQDHSQILSYEEILRIVRVLIPHGLTRVRVTGGEPLVRLGITEFIKQLSALPLADIAMTTNGSLLAAMAADLKQAGLNRVNISLDTVNPAYFQQITGGGNLADVMLGVTAARAAGLTPLKLNVVATTYLTDADLAYYIKLTRRQQVYVRFIEYMPIGSRPNQGLGISIAALRSRIETIAGPLKPACCSGSGPARYYSLTGACGLIGFITPISEHFCHSCNRIRLTADGKIKPCLLSDDEYDLKTPLRQGISDTELVELLMQAVRNKPAGHALTAGSACSRQMSQIGG